MPIIKSAKKKLKQDKKKTAVNKVHEVALNKALKGFEADLKNKKKVTLDKIFSVIDKGVSKKLIAKNKAARLKSRFAKRLKPADKKKGSS